MVAAIVGGKKLVRMLRIANDAIEVGHCIEMTCGPDPLVYRLAVGLAQRTGVIIAGAHVRSNRRANDVQAMGVSPSNDLLIRAENSLNEGSVLGRGNFAVASKAAKVIHALKHDYPLNSGWGQHIAIEARQCIRAQTVG